MLSTAPAGSHHADSSASCYTADTQSCSVEGLSSSYVLQVVYRLCAASCLAKYIAVLSGYPSSILHTSLLNQMSIWIYWFIHSL